MGNIRACTFEDLNWMVGIARKFNSLHYDVPLNLDKTAEYLLSMIYADEGVALRSDKGAIVGVLAPDPMRDWTVMVELGWFTEGRDGLRLLRAFENLARERNADEVRMTTLEANKQVERILSKRYAKIETSHRLLL